jgi:uncharacterized protein YjbI with pentapeptide repeats
MNEKNISTVKIPSYLKTDLGLVELENLDCGENLRATNLRATNLRATNLRATNLRATMRR